MHFCIKSSIGTQGEAVGCKSACLFSLSLGAWRGLRFMIVTLPGLFSYFFYMFVHVIINERQIMYRVILVNVVPG